MCSTKLPRNPSSETRLSSQLPESFVALADGLQNALWSLGGTPREAVLAEFERNLLMERCAAGVKIARQRNVRFGRPPKLTPSLIRRFIRGQSRP